MQREAQIMPDAMRDKRLLKDFEKGRSPKVK
jgi:hypothetical protein